MKAVITVIGKDRVGIIAGVSGVLADRQVNILDISQTIMEDMFTMMMLVDTQESTVPFSELADILVETGKGLAVSIQIQHEDIFNSMHRI